MAQRQFEISFVFFRRMLDYLYASGAESFDFLVGERVEIADDRMRRQTKRAGVERAAIRADDAGRIQRGEQAIEHQTAIEFAIGEEKHIHRALPQFP